MKIAVIPARGGSKRIPRKNIRLFQGKPMIAWSIATALESECFDHVLVSTDDEEIASIARNYGAEIPFMRPANLSDDHALTQSVIQHSLTWCEEEGLSIEGLCCLYPTAPFVQADDLRKAHDLVDKVSEKTFIFAATSFSFPIQRAIKINAEGRSSMFQPECFSIRSQDLEEAYHDAGQFYWARPSGWKTTVNIFDNGHPIILPRWRVIDIDNEDDWIRAEIMHHAISRIL